VGPTDAIAFLALMVMLTGGFVALGPIGRALADRLRGRAREGALGSGEVDALRDELQSLRHHVEELAERQDFAERLLAQAKERGLLNAPSKGERA